MRARRPSGSAPTTRRRGLVTTTILGLVAAPLLVPGLASANPTGTGLVISEVYSAGGNVGSAFTSDFVELYNPTDADVDLAGRSLQYRAGGGTAQVLALAGTVRPESHFLVQMTTAADGDAALPTPDLVASPDVPLGGPSGQVFLATTTTPFVDTGNVAGNAALLDMVGYGTAGTFEGARTNVALSEDLSASRDANGTDTDHNDNDFTEGVPSPEGSPAPVTMNLLLVNDFHGRINANTVKWAGTVEKLTADAEAAGQSTLLVGAGDLIGASEFASSVQQDQPTIEVMNALGLDASAVGNHEFDQGWADLRDRVIGPSGSRNALWEYLGANVYAKGTTDPVLPEYALFDVDGVQVAVVGAVTEETSTLVSPGGITTLDFGDPVEAVNRVAGELSDGAPGNGEADVVVASFHAGAQVGVGSTYDAEFAKGGEFAAMASLDASVDVIFNGHTHQVYAWDAPRPGGGTRPMLQTGSYAENVGQVTLTVDPITGDVASYTAANVARVTTPDADLVAAYPRVATVKTIVDDALAYAAVIGNDPVGEVTGDITRAFSNGSFVSGSWVAPTPRTEDRLSESSLGDLVATALREGMPGDIGVADLGLVNPGGLRADLLFAGDTTTNPANTDGVVTYAEANAVLPFINNVWLVDLTGAELKAVLEQQWQTNPGGPAPSRPFLHLGLSDNVTTTLDPTQPEGSRVTSVTIDGQALDPAATYTVSTFSFLGTGGDNFRAFKDGTARDTGLVDRDLWIDYLQATVPVTPDFARQQVYESGLPDLVYPSESVAFTLTRLDLTSLGSPENTTLEIVASDGGTDHDLGSVPVAGGTAAVAFDVPGSYAGGGTVTLTAQPSGTTVRIPIGVRGTSTVSGSAAPFAYGQAGTVAASVTPADATGTVELLDGATTVSSGSLAGGSVDLTIPAGTLRPGTTTLTLSYLGDTTHAPSTGTVDVEVTAAAATVTATATSASVVVRSGTTAVAVDVIATGVIPTGTVEAYVDGTLAGSASLDTGGSAVIEVGPFSVVGSEDVEVRYLGDATVAPGTDTVSVQVVRATPVLKVARSPKVIHVRRTRPVLAVTLTAPGFTVRGQVRVVAAGRTVTKRLTGGKATFTLPAFTTTGLKTVTVRYLGNALANPVTKRVSFRVVR